MDLKAYFKRIGYTKVPKVDFDTLSELHRLHTYAIPFENLNPFTYKEVLLDLDSLEKKMVQELRGGYCFEQNILFSSVLKEIGFSFRWLGARVLWNQPEDLITRRSHMLFLVDLEGKTYLCDVGFGGMTLTTPIKFKTDIVQKTTHEDFRLLKYEEDLVLQANVADVWKTIYRFDMTIQYEIDYEVANYYLYTNPTSHFRNMLIAAKPFPEGRLALSNTQFTTHLRNGESQKQQLTSPAEIKKILSEKFGIKLPDGPELDSRLSQLFL